MEKQEQESQIDASDSSPSNIKNIQKHNDKVHKSIAALSAKIEEKKKEFIAEPSPKEMTLAECNAATKKAKISDKVAPAMAMQRVSIKPVVPQRLEQTEVTD